MGTASGATTCTSAPSLRPVAATSQPMNPAPTMTIRVPWVINA